MNSNLNLKKNCALVNKQAKAIIAAVKKRIAEKEVDMIFGASISINKLRILGIHGISYLRISLVEVLDHGWLMPKILLEDPFPFPRAYYQKKGKKLNGILKSKSNPRIAGDRSTHVHCPYAIKGQILILIEIGLEKKDEESFLVINQKGKIIKSHFGQILTHNWDANSEESIASIVENKNKIIYFEW